MTARPPGSVLHRVARALLDPDDMVRAVEPAIADFQRSPGEPALGWQLRIVALIVLIIARRRLERFVATPWLRLVPAMAAVVLGAWAFRDEAPSRAFAAQQVGFLAFGALVAVAAGTTRPSRVSQLDLVIAIAIVGLVLVVALGDPTMGVRRWLPVLGWNLQITLVVWPLYVAAITSLLAHRALAAMATALVCLALLIIVRDVQASLAWGVATAIAVATSRLAASWRISLTLAIAATIALALIRAPSLPAMAHVEGVLALVASRGAFAVALAAACAVLVVATPFAIARRTARRAPRGAALAIGGTLVALVASPVILPNEPVVLFGYGGSGIIGVFLALGIALSIGRDSARPMTT